MTEPRFLLDTNICIYVLRDAEGAAARRLADCEPGSAVVSAISFAEVMRGADKEMRRAFEAFFAVVPVLPFDREAADSYDRVPFRRGRFDRLIAAHALALDLTLVTDDEGDFADVPDLKIENWTLAQ